MSVKWYMSEWESGQQVAIAPLMKAKEFENFVVNNC